MAVMKIKDANGNWQNIVALKGDRGEPGPEGPQGPQGLPGGVTSVNGMTGDVTLQVGGSDYTLPAATSSTLGGVKIGNNITVSSGTISLTKTNVTNALGFTPAKEGTTTTSGIPVSGARGSLAGYSTVGSTTSFDGGDEYDSNQVASSVYVYNSTSGRAWTKIIRFTSTPSVTLSGSKWTWKDNTAPTLSTGGILVLCWCGDAGIASFIAP